MPKAKDIHKLSLRLPVSTYEKVARAAKRSGRSMNSEVISCIEESYLLSSEAELTSAVKVAILKASKGDGKALIRSLSKLVTTLECLDDKKTK